MSVVGECCPIVLHLVSVGRTAAGGGGVALRVQTTNSEHPPPPSCY